MCIWSLPRSLGSLLSFLSRTLHQNQWSNPDKSMCIVHTSRKKARRECVSKQIELNVSPSVGVRLKFAISTRACWLVSNFSYRFVHREVALTSRWYPQIVASSNTFNSFWTAVIVDVCQKTLTKVFAFISGVDGNSGNVTMTWSRLPFSLFTDRIKIIPFKWRTKLSTCGCDWIECAAKVCV